MIHDERALPRGERLLLGFVGITSWNPLARGSFGAPIESEEQPLAPGRARSS